mmetsp:Transcript_48795/g.131400  ORF Transcript_48795/g.131400 Transcript_48795/m.131400 type:complete len:242 (-) Transcript_48795:753-1478(-)
MPMVPNGDDCGPRASLRPLPSERRARRPPTGGAPPATSTQLVFPTTRPPGGTGTVTSEAGEAEEGQQQQPLCTSPRKLWHRGSLSRALSSPYPSLLPAARCAARRGEAARLPREEARSARTLQDGAPVDRKITANCRCRSHPGGPPGGRRGKGSQSDGLSSPLCVLAGRPEIGAAEGGGCPSDLGELAEAAPGLLDAHCSEGSSRPQRTRRSLPWTRGPTTTPPSWVDAALRKRHADQHQA